MALLVDDAVPHLNPIYYHRRLHADDPQRVRNRAGVPWRRTIPLSLLDRFCDVVAAAGARGKFSVVPNPMGLGELDRGFPGCSRRRCRRWVDTVRSRLGRDFDVTPEMLTHFYALDLGSGRFLTENEHDWSQRQSAASLTRYLAHASAILQRVGLDPDGFTSPWAFGEQVEEAMARAALRAQQQVNGRSLTWYFLTIDQRRRRVLPRPMVLRPAAREAVVSIVAGTTDYMWDTMQTTRKGERYASERASLAITAAGRGRIADLVESGSFVALLTHWQSLHSNGTEAGLAVLGRIFTRVNRLLGDRIVWMKCSEMARYYAAAKASRARAVAEGIALRSPFTCPGFTISMAARRRPRSIRVNGQALRRVESPLGLRAGAWTWRDGRTYLCFDLEERCAIQSDR
jgi:hypothetical protein